MMTNKTPFGECSNCDYEFNSELISEYNIKHCPNCGAKIMDTELVWDDPTCEDDGSCKSGRRWTQVMCRRSSPAISCGATE